MKIIMRVLLLSVCDSIRQPFISGTILSLSAPITLSYITAPIAPLIEPCRTPCRTSNKEAELIQIQTDEIMAAKWAAKSQ